MIKNRYLVNEILEDINEKMVFIGGPRQVGKTTLSCELVGKKFDSYRYFNWDYREDRNDILASNWPSDSQLMILDEIYKYKKWKSLIKGEYDKLKDRYKFLITGCSQRK